MAKVFAISITTWAEHQERADRGNYTWCKLYSKMLTGSFWRLSTLEQKAMFVALMMMRNAQEQDTIIAPDFVLAGNCGEGVKIHDVEKILLALMGYGLIQDEARQFPGKTQAFSCEPLANSWPREEEKREEERREERRAGGTPAALPPVFAPHEGRFSAKAKSLLLSVKPESIDGWWQSYPDPEFFILEANKAANWILANSRKAPKNFAPFFTRWLGKAWEDYRKRLPSNPAGFSEEPEWVKRAKAEEEAQRRKNAV